MLVEARWRQRQCRSESGIYFPSDEVVELCGAPQTGYHADIRVPFASLIRSEPDAWVDLEELCFAETDEAAIYAGASSAENGGFIAAEAPATKRLRWLLHVTEAAPFAEVTMNGETIRAISGTHRQRHEWLISLSEPEAFTIVWAYE